MSSSYYHCKHNISIILYAYYNFSDVRFIYPEDYSESKPLPLPSDTELKEALLLYFPWVMIIKGLIGMTIPYVVCLLNKKKRLIMKP